MGVTIDDVAELANTSTATVSRALNGKPGVTEATRQRIIVLADKLGYRPNRIAQNLALQKSHVIGLVAADLRNPFYIEFFRRIQHAVGARGYQVLIADSELDVEKEKHNIEVMRQHRAEGIFIFPVCDWRASLGVDHLLELRLRRFPFVVVGKVPGMSVDCVTSDELNTARKLTCHLLELGHRSIGFVGFDTNNRPIRERLEGVVSALGAAGCSLDPAHVVELTDDWRSGLTTLLRRPDRPTALVMVSDVCALMANRPIIDTGLEVPRDLSLVTFENSLWTEHMKPSLTTTLENLEGVAQSALAILEQRMADLEAPPQVRLIPQEIVIRESTAPCPHRSLSAM
jgi:LacI family transcriptional regulator